MFDCPFLLCGVGEGEGGCEVGEGGKGGGGLVEVEVVQVLMKGEVKDGRVGGVEGVTWEGVEGGKCEGVEDPGDMMMEGGWLEGVEEVAGQGVEPEDAQAAAAVVASQGAELVGVAPEASWFLMGMNVLPCLFPDTD